MPMRARRRRASASSPAAVRSVPRTCTWPFVAHSSPPMIISREDLPEPEGPVTATRSPLEISKLMSRRISTLPAAPGKLSPSSCSFITGSLMSAARSLAARQITARPIAAARYAATLLIRKLAIIALALALLIPSAEARTLRLIAFGDSLTSGYGLPAEQGFTAQLQHWLEERDHDVEVVNMGVAGDTTTGGLARLEWALAEGADAVRSEEHTSELQSRGHLVCRLLLEKKKENKYEQIERST